MSREAPAAISSIISYFTHLKSRRAQLILQYKPQKVASLYSPDDDIREGIQSGPAIAQLKYILSSGTQGFLKRILCESQRMSFLLSYLMCSENRNPAAHDSGCLKCSSCQLPASARNGTHLQNPSWTSITGPSAHMLHLLLRQVGGSLMSRL